MAARLLAISGSLRAASINTAALEALALVAPEDVEVIVYRDLGRLPAFNPDEDEEGRLPPEVEALRTLVRQSDGVAIAAPEYAHGVPGALKNALDWLVASDAVPGKPFVLLNAAPRAFHAQSALRETLATMSARLVPEAFVTLPLAGRAIDARQIIGDPRLARALREGLETFLSMVGPS
ncbi:MAG: NAD(P)H-dependent oxidoreductase [Hyphomicrobiales bacterium]|nr:NAD(P)H-dependent oxidoreductase [Hyphomicrobiales bacterium]